MPSLRALPPTLLLCLLPRGAVQAAPSPPSTAGLSISSPAGSDDHQHLADAAPATERSSGPPATAPEQPALPAVAPGAPAQEDAGKTTPPPQPAARSPWSWSGESRTMATSMTWFDGGQGYENRYTFLSNRLRARLRYSEPGLAGMCEVQNNLLVGLPTRAIAPAPQGQLGLGGAFYANTLRPSLDTAGLRQAWIKVGGSKGLSAQIGRQEFASNAEVKQQDEVLDWIQRARLKERLIGTFDFSEYARTFDGVRLDWDSEGHHMTGFVARPTQGGFEPHFATSLDRTLVSHLSWTLKQSPSHPSGEGQLFWSHYDDTRNVAFVDNRPLALRGNVASQGGVHVDTFGLHYMTRLGSQGDAVAWYAYQTGRWGTLTHQASALMVEAGLRPSEVPWQPWVRVGYYRASGDSNPNDRVHGTFFGPQSTPRLYARFPYYNLSNIQDTSLQVLMVPYQGALLRTDLHTLTMDKGQDLWYAGSGAFQRNTFGLAGRTVGGPRHLGTLLDVSLEHTIQPNMSLVLYLAKAWGGSAIRRIYPNHPDGSAMFVEWIVRKL